MKPNIKTKRGTQWGWFFGLWCMGLVVTAILSLLVRWVIRNL